MKNFGTFSITKSIKIVQISKFTFDFFIERDGYIAVSDFNA